VFNKRLCAHSGSYTQYAPVAVAELRTGDLMRGAVDVPLCSIGITLGRMEL
jgi:hypothetical protein